jgi:hypothetical protein
LKKETYNSRCYPYVCEIEDARSKVEQPNIHKVGDMPVEKQSIQDIPHSAGKDQANGYQFTGPDIPGMNDHIYKHSHQNRQGQDAQEPKAYARVKIISHTHGCACILDIFQSKTVMEEGASPLIVTSPVILIDGADPELFCFVM